MPPPLTTAISPAGPRAAGNSTADVSPPGATRSAPVAFCAPTTAEGVWKVSASRLLRATSPAENEIAPCSTETAISPFLAAGS